MKLIFYLVLLIINCGFSLTSQILRRVTKSVKYTDDRQLLDSMKGCQLIGIGEAAHFSATYYTFQGNLTESLIDSLHVSTVFIENRYAVIADMISLEGNTLHNLREYRELIKRLHNKGVRVIGINPGNLYVTWDLVTKFLNYVASDVGAELKSINQMDRPVPDHD